LKTTKSDLGVIRRGKKLALQTILEGFVTGHDFSRAANETRRMRALAPERRLQKLTLYPRLQAAG
jgi:hypothetical protein